MPIQYVQTTGQQQVGFSFTPSPIQGLTLILPEGAGEQALVILNVPNAQGIATQGQTGGGQFGITVNGVASPTIAAFNFFNPGMGGQMYMYGQAPVTLVVAVPLILQAQQVAATWQSLGYSLSITTPASLSALI